MTLPTGRTIRWRASADLVLECAEAFNGSRIVASGHILHNGTMNIGSVRAALPGEWERRIADIIASRYSEPRQDPAQELKRREDITRVLTTLVEETVASRPLDPEKVAKSAKAAAAKRKKKIALAERDGLECALCHRPLSNALEGRLHHMVPYELYPTWANSALVLACPDCHENTAKRVPILMALLIARVFGIEASQ
ncbi:HNH endonuclease [Actinacidiphila acididurans]|uniref:HNH endonuclease n=1 Tax=Actinacidiphila acididurans TaxID=2784346 RepID=A0ABS2U5F7_9ACTN|nr:HNH endonuclease [Actinacidiphila acididurans]MBM9509951.1 HNH endonuclease [Actinacidiphila acididurans]